MESHATEIDYEEAVKVSRMSSAPRVLVVCEHASNRVPAQLHGLGLNAQHLASHIAWDPGALEVAKGLAARVPSVLIAGNVSRLVYDCNRPPDAKSAIPEQSEIHDVPGNKGLTPFERLARVDAIYRPFHAAVSKAIREARDTVELMVTVHSFTPVYDGKARTVEIGILHGSDPRFAAAMMACRPDQSVYDIRLNQPYSARDGVTHTLDLHGPVNGLHSVMIEIRNDLIQTDEAQDRMADQLAEWIEDTLHALENGGQAQ